MARQSCLHKSLPLEGGGQVGVKSFYIERWTAPLGLGSWDSSQRLARERSGEGEAPFG